MPMREFCFDSGSFPREKDKERTNEFSDVRLYVRLSRHFSVNEPHVAGEPSWSTRAARPPLRHVPRFNFPPAVATTTTGRSVHDFIPTGRRSSTTPRLTSGFPRFFPSPPLSTPRRRGYNPFHLQDSLPTRSLNSSRSLPPLFFISFTLLGVPFARLLPHRHLQPPPCFPAAYLPLSLSLSLSPSISFSPLPSPSRVAQCRNTYDGTSVLLTSQVSALG